MKKTRKKGTKTSTVEVCAICGKIAKEEDYQGEAFVCSHCGSNVSVVMSKEMFLKIPYKK